jgi:hypothetical protein
VYDFRPFGRPSHEIAVVVVRKYRIVKAQIGSGGETYTHYHGGE